MRKEESRSTHLYSAWHSSSAAASPSSPSSPSSSAFLGGAKAGAATPKVKPPENALPAPVEAPRAAKGFCECIIIDQIGDEDALNCLHGALTDAAGASEGAGWSLIVSD